MAGPAAGRPCMRTLEVLPCRTRPISRSMTCACRMEGTVKFSPAAAVPVRTKMPEPMIAPMPRAVRLHGPSVFLSRCSGCSASAISLSMDFLASSWLPWGAAGGCLASFVVVSATVLLWAVGVFVRVRWGAWARGFAPGGRGKAPPLHKLLPFRLAAHHLFHLALLRAASIIPLLFGILLLLLFALGALAFLALFFAQSFSICHECVYVSLDNSLASS